MSRVATLPFQRTMSSAVQRSQEALAKTTLQIGTEKKVNSYADLGSNAVSNLSAHSLIEKQNAYVDTSKQVANTMALNDANMGAIDDSAVSLKNSLLSAIGTKQGVGLNDAITAAFDQFRAALNASDGGKSLFGGSQTDTPPFVPATLADTLTTPAATAFANDDIKASARLSDNVNVQYGVTASDIGSGLYSAFQTLAGVGTIGKTPTDAQIAALSTAAGQIDTGLVSMRAVNAGNGLKQAQVDTLSTRASDRSVLLQGIVGDNEDADVGQLNIDLAQQKLVYQASLSVFSQLNGLSLVNYLK